MNKLAKLKKELAALQAEGQTILNAVEAANDEWTEEQETRFAELETEMDAKKAEIKKAEEMAEKRRLVGGVAIPAQVSGGDANPDMTAGFADIGEFASAVVKAVGANQHGGTIDQRLVALTNPHQGGGAEGEGYMLPPQYRDEIWELVTGFDEFGPLIDEEPTSAREVKLGADESTPWSSSGIQAYWRAEGKKMDPTKMLMDPRSVPLHELYAMATATEELLEDAPRLNNRLTKKAAEAIAFKKNEAIVEGSGVGQPLGWMKSKAMVEVAKEQGQTAGTIVAKNVIKMFTRLQTAPGDRTFWLTNQDTLPQLMTMTIGDKPIWTPPNGLSDAPGGFILGRPVRFSEFAESLGSKGDLQLISPKGYYGARRTQGVKFATSIHLFFDYNAQAFRWVFRYGGQPHLSAPIKPNKGNSTRSHFVTLAERA